jgi:hypothetical protein
VHFSVFDIAILVHGYEQDGGVSIAVCCTLASVQKQGRMAIEPFCSLRRLIIYILVNSSSILFEFFFVAR